MSKLESIRYKRGHLEILDQLKIPREHLYIDIQNTEQGRKVKYLDFSIRVKMFDSRAPSNRQLSII